MAITQLANIRREQGLILVNNQHFTLRRECGILGRETTIRKTYEETYLQDPGSDLFPKLWTYYQEPGQGLGVKPKRSFKLQVCNIVLWCVHH